MFYIDEKNDSVVVEFGKGTMRVGSGLRVIEYTDNTEEKVGCIYIQENEEVLEVGTLTNEESNENYDMVLTFSNTKSVDAIINKLQKMKEFMIKEGIK